MKYGQLQDQFSLTGSACSPAANDQNCSLFDKSIKLCQIMYIPVVNIFRYGASPNYEPALLTSHVPNRDCMKTRLRRTIVFYSVVSIYQYNFDAELWLSACAIFYFSHVTCQSHGLTRDSS